MVGVVRWLLADFCRPERSLRQLLRVIRRALDLLTGRNRPILLKKSDFQLAQTHARSPSENPLTTLSGFSALR